MYLHMPRRGMHLPDEGPVLVVGAGAIGTLVAARLAGAGTQVAVAARDRAGAARLAAGLTATGPDGAETHAKVPVVWRPADLPARPRMLVLATKCADAEAALMTWLGSL